MSIFEPISSRNCNKLMWNKLTDSLFLSQADVEYKSVLTQISAEHATKKLKSCFVLSKNSLYHVKGSKNWMQNTEFEVISEMKLDWILVSYKNSNSSSENTKLEKSFLVSSQKLAQKSSAVQITINNDFLNSSSNFAPVLTKSESIKHYLIENQLYSQKTIINEKLRLFALKEQKLINSPNMQLNRVIIKGKKEINGSSTHTLAIQNGLSSNLSYISSKKKMKLMAEKILKTENYEIKFLKNGEECTFSAKDHSILQKWMDVLAKKCIQTNFKEKFKLNGKLSSGDTISVFQGFDRKNLRYVAVKRINKSKLTKNGDQHVHQLLEYLKFLKKGDQLSFLPTLFEIHESQKHIFIVTELLEGQTFQQLDQKLNQSEIISILQHVSSGLSELSAIGVNLMYLRPENLMYKRQGELNDQNSIKLIGIRENLEVRQNLTDLIEMNVGYLAPELLKINNQNNNSQQKYVVFSFGVILYEIISKQRGFNGADFAEIFKKNKKCSINLEVSAFSNVSEAGLLIS